MHASLNHLFIRMIFYINMIFTITGTHFEHMDKGRWLYMNTQINKFALLWGEAQKKIAYCCPKVTTYSYPKVTCNYPKVTYS